MITILAHQAPGVTFTVTRLKDGARVSADNGALAVVLSWDELRQLTNACADVMDAYFDDLDRGVRHA